MIEVRVSDNGMRAEVALYPEDDEILSFEYIKENLQVEGVHAGIEDSVINIMLKDKIYGEFVPVASGKEAVNGTDGSYDFFFVTEEENKGPRIREDGSVDYTKLITNVKAGDLLAEYHPKSNGAYGYNVFSTMLPPAKGRELKALRCKNVRKDENKYYAEKDGYVTKSGNTIAIEDVLEIEGDVDQTVGDLDFNGDINVHGSILTGMVVKAHGNVIVDGVIENAKVYADKDVIVGKGIHGQGEALIEAKGGLSTVFVEHAIVKTNGNINVDYVVNSVIESDGLMVADGKRGAVIGGVVTAAGGIDAKYYGNDKELPTKICVGISMARNKELQRYKNQLKEIEEKLAGFDEDEAPELIKTMLTDVRAKINELENKSVVEKSAPIIVRNNIFPGVKCYLDDLLANEIYGRGNIELRNINHNVVCRRAGTFSATELKTMLTHADAGNSKTKPKILAIDDDPIMLRTINEMLKDDYRVSVTKSGEEARNFLAVNKVSLILLDYMMPDENGVEVLKSLRTDYETANIPVVFLSGLDDRKKIMECLALKPAGYVMKPVEKEKLLKKIRAVLGGVR